MTERCEDCPEIKMLSFEVKGLDLSLQKQRIIIEGVQQENLNRDIEHETMIQGLTTRMDNLTQEFTSLKNDVKEDIKSIKEEIPKLFEESMNRLLAKVGKWFLIGLVAVALTSVIAWNRPIILGFLQEITQRIEGIDK